MKKQLREAAKRAFKQKANWAWLDVTSEEEFYYLADHWAAAAVSLDNDGSVWFLLLAAEAS